MGCKAIFSPQAIEDLAAAILTDIDPGLPARRIGAAKDRTSVNSKRFVRRRFFPGGRMPHAAAGKDACRHTFRPALIIPQPYSAAVRIMSRVKNRIRPQFGQVTSSAAARQWVTICAGSFMWQPPQALCSMPTTTCSPLLLISRS